MTKRTVLVGGVGRICSNLKTWIIVHIPGPGKASEFRSTQLNEAIIIYILTGLYHNLVFL